MPSGLPEIPLWRNGRCVHGIVAFEYSLQEHLAWLRAQSPVHARLYCSLQLPLHATLAKLINFYRYSFGMIPQNSEALKNASVHVKNH